MLISGRFRLRFRNAAGERDAVLADQGDYAVWSRGTDHSWIAEEDSTVLTVRWPSIPGYAVAR